MIKNHLKMSFRSLSKRRLYAIINFIGLSMAIMIGLLAFVFVEDEFGYNQAHKNADNLFLLYRMDFKADNPKLEPGWFDAGPDPGLSKGYTHNLPFLEQVEAEVPEIDRVIRVENNYINVNKDGKSYGEYVTYTDSSFFSAFTFEFLYGQQQTVLRGVKDAVISEKIALKYFGRSDVVGQILPTGESQTGGHLITGVIKTPANSSIDANIVLNLQDSEYYKNNQSNWGYQAISCFIYLQNPESKEQVASKINSLYKQRFQKNIDAQREMLKLSEANPVVQYDLKNLSSLYLDPSIRYGSGSSSPLYSIILIAIALIILLIACINYLSISIASSGGRQLEVAVRKVMGASGLQLRSQFYTEAFLLTMISALGGFTLMQLCLPKFNELAGKSIELGFGDNLMMLLASLHFGLILTILAGLYPAQVLARFKAVSGLKGGATYKIRPMLIKSMVVFQFVLCLFFISMSLIMKRQFNYINNKDLGFDKEQVVYVRGVWGNTHLLKQELVGNTAIESATGSSGIFSPSTSRGSIVVNNVQYWVTSARVDFDFFKTFNIKLVEGQYFDPNMGVKALENREIVNQNLYQLYKADTSLFNAAISNVQGVVKDFHFQSLQRAIQPFSFRVVEPNGLSDLYVKLKPGRTEEGIAAINEAIRKILPQSEAEVRFFDDYLNSRYKDSQKWRQIINTATILGIVIACIGLFGLTGINMANRTKEIGIRKVLGAGFDDIILLLNKQTLWLVAISTAISLPLSYYFMDRWLQSFAYSASITADLFLLSTGLCLLVVAVTVSFHSIKSMLTNPVESLRYE